MVSVVFAGQERLLEIKSHRAIHRSGQCDQTRQRIFHAATRIVSEIGYAGASVRKIADAAGVAPGTIYLHFESRQDLLDTLLPTLGISLRRYIDKRVRFVHSGLAREVARLGAFIDYLEENPGFVRLLNEAKYATPAGFHQYINDMARPHRMMLRRAHGPPIKSDMTDAEIDFIVQLLIGVFVSVSKIYSNMRKRHILSAYYYLLGNGLLATFASKVGGDDPTISSSS